MKKLITAIAVALFALSGTAAYAADEKKAEPAKPAASKAADKPASGAKAADKSASAATTAKKKEKKGGC
jgi:hypothetical protein